MLNNFFSWDNEYFKVKIGDVVNPAVEYSPSLKTISTNNYGPFTPEMGNDYCGADSLYDIPICSSCGTYGCCDNTK